MMSKFVVEECEEAVQSQNGVISQNVKKILPSVPDGKPMKFLERQNNLKMDEQYKAVFLEYALMTEYVLIQKTKIDGAYLVPSAGSPLKWFGVLFVRQGLYQGGVFRFNLYVPDDYPNCDCPVIVFESTVFHPLVNIDTGEVDTKRAFRKWTNLNHLWQVIVYVKRMFYKIDTQLPLNPEAAVLYEKDLELFKLKVAESISLSHERLYEKPLTDDQNAIWFSELDPPHYEEIRKKIQQKKAPDEDSFSKTQPKQGLSWVTKGTSQAFSNAGF